MPSPNDSNPLFEKYQLFWTYVNSVDSSLVKPDSIDLQRGSSGYRVTGLISGVEYIFTLYTFPQSLAIRPYTSIRWAPAKNYGLIMLSSGSVLALNDTTRNTAGPSILPMDDPRAQSLGDIYLDLDLTLKSTSFMGAGWRQTLFSTAQIQAPSLPVPLPAFPPVGTFTDSIVSVQPQTIYFCKTGDGHYVRLYVKDIPPVESLRVLVNLDVSYQTRTALPFAKRSGE
jgi:hypothetical protein